MIDKRLYPNRKELESLEQSRKKHKLNEYRLTGRIPDKLYYKPNISGIALPSRVERKKGFQSKFI